MCCLLPCALPPHLCGWEDPLEGTEVTPDPQCWGACPRDHLVSLAPPLLPLLVLFGKVKVRHKEGEMRLEMSSPQDSTRSRTVVLDSWLLSTSCFPFNHTSEHTAASLRPAPGSQDPPPRPHTSAHLCLLTYSVESALHTSQKEKKNKNKMYQSNSLKQT